MLTLPYEILEEIISELSTQDLLRIALTSRVCHSLATTRIYWKIQHIQLIGWGEQAHLPSIKCLETLATAGHGPSVARHFAVQGLPWIEEATMQMLSQALVNMTGLVSIDFAMGAQPETSLFTESRCSCTSFLPHLQAISLHDWAAALPLVAGRPVEYLRIRTMMNADAFSELLIGLSMSSKPIKCLQVCVAVPTVASAAAIMANITQVLPSLNSLSIVFSLPAPRWSERLLVAVEEIIDSLVALNGLTEFGLAMIPEILYLKGTKTNVADIRACFDAVHSHLPHLRLIELQWEAQEHRNGAWNSLSKDHQLMRRKWRYPHGKKF